MVHRQTTQLGGGSDSSDILIALPDLPELPEDAQGSPQVRFASSVAAVVRQHRKQPTSVLICHHPSTSSCARWIRSQPGGGSVVVVITHDRQTSSLDQAMAFAEEVRADAVLPTETALPELLRAARAAAAERAQPPSPAYLKKILTLSRLWVRKKTGTIRAWSRDGAYTTVTLRAGQLISPGDQDIFRRALQDGTLNFTISAVSDRPSGMTMGQLLMDLASEQCNPDLTSQRDERHPLVLKTRLDELPLSEACRKLLAVCDGRHPLGLLYTAHGVKASALNQELHALCRLGLLKLQAPGHSAEETSYDSALCDKARRRLERDLDRLSRQHGAARLGLPMDAPPLLVQRLSRRLHDRYADLADNPRWPEDIRGQASRIKRMYLSEFLTAGSSVPVRRAASRSHTGDIPHPGVQ